LRPHYLAAFIIERFRALVVLVSFYYFWSALLRNRTSFAGYDHAQMITYVFGMNVLRSLVFASRTYEIAGEINHGRLSGYLLKPVNFFIYTFSRDLAEKTTNLVSAIIEILGLSLIFRVSLQLPKSGMTWLLFLFSVLGAMALYFLLSFMVGCWGFWTAESGGPRFLLELVLEFSAGAFFPLDILSPAIQHVLKQFPSPYLVFFPLHIFLERLNPTQIIEGFLAQGFWIAALGWLAWFVWQRGISTYSAEGS